MVAPVPAQISRLLLRLHGANPPTTHLPPSSPSSASRNTRIPSALNSFHILPVATEVYHQSIPDDNLSSLQTRQLFCLHRLAASLPSLCALFCIRFLCFQSFAASFCKTPGVGVPPQIPPLESATSSLFLALSAASEGFPLQLQLLQLSIRRRMRILRDDRELTQSHSPFSPLATRPSPLSSRPLFATLTHTLSRKSFPCHSYADTRDGSVTIAPVSASVSPCLCGESLSFKHQASTLRSSGCYGLLTLGLLTAGVLHRYDDAHRRDSSPRPDGPIRYAVSLSVP